MMGTFKSTEDVSDSIRSIRSMGTADKKLLRKRRLRWDVIYLNPMNLSALTVILIVLFMAVFGRYLAPYDPLAVNAVDKLLPFGSPEHFLGTDHLGRDILSRMLHGVLPSVLSSILPVLIAGCIGTVLGVTAGYYGKWVNLIIMRALDMFYAFPAILLALTVGAALGPGLITIVTSLSIVFIPPIARLAEGAVRGVTSEEYMEAARLSGANDIQIIFTHVLRNIIDQIFIYCTILTALSLVFASGLSFLGLGINPPQPEWGVILNDLQYSIYSNPWLPFVPGVAILLTSLSFNVLGDALKDVFGSSTLSR